MGPWRFWTSCRGIMWSKELHLHSRGWSRGWDFCWVWGQSSTTGLPSLFTTPCRVLLQSLRALWRSEELLYLLLSVQNSSMPFGTVQLRATLEWGVSVYLVRSSWTSGQWKGSDCGLCGPGTVLCEPAPELGVLIGLGDRSSWMTSWSQVLNGSLRLGLPVNKHAQTRKHAWAHAYLLERAKYQSFVS